MRRENGGNHCPDDVQVSILREIIALSLVDIFLRYGMVKREVTIPCSASNGSFYQKCRKDIFRATLNIMTGDIAD